MGASQSHNTDTIGWNNIDTNAMSSSIQNIKGLSNEASQLVAKLNLPDIDQTSSSEFNTEKILNKINNSNDKIENDKDEELSSSSPFINTDMYNYIVKQKNNNLVGGGDIDDDSSTSSTSDSDDEDEDEDDKDDDDELDDFNKKSKKSKSKGKKSNKKESYKGSRKTLKNKKNTSEESFNGLNTENYDYVSSSAHTGGSYSDKNTSITNENQYQTSSSIRTSDINRFR
jgi:hypothetical protein